MLEPLPDWQRTIERLWDRYSGQHDGLLRNWMPMDDGIADEHRYTITREQYHSPNPEH